ncbi:MAG: TrmB family transcriptional regulator [Haloarculaceae archaeon]
MDEAELTDELQEVGFTKYESSAYVAAVSLGSASPKELADSSEVPRARIYDVIDDLREMGLLEVQETGNGKRVQAPPPEVVLDQFRERRIDSFSDRIDAISASLSGLHDDEQSTEGFVTMLSMDESALRHMRRAVEDAEWWLTLALPVAMYDDLAAPLADAVDRGVTVRLVVDGDEARGADPRPGRMGPNFPEGLTVRHRPSLDTFVFADRTYGVFNSKHPQEKSQPYIVTQERNLVMLFQIYAEQVWTGSGAIQTDDGLPKRYLDPWRAIVDLRDGLDAGRTYVAEIEGRETHTRSPGTWTGEIVDYELSSPGGGDFAAVSPTKATLTVDTGDGERTVGGWKATIEEIAAVGLTVREG